MAVVDAWDPIPADARRSGAPAGVGRVGFALESGTALIGVGAALLFPDDGGRPAFGRWRDVVATQRDGALDLRGWLDRTTPTGAHHLKYGLWLDGPEGREFRVGWARLDADLLQYGSLSVPCPRRSTLRVAVRTAGGAPVPGALLGLDRSRLFPLGLLTSLACTDESGRLLVTGLAPGRTWILRLPDGVGPVRRRLEREVRSGDDVTWRIDRMQGRWAFVRAEVRFPIAGGATRLEDCRAPDDVVPSVWPVSAWIGPGQGPSTPFYLAAAVEERPLPASVRLTFRAHAPVRFDDTSRPRTFVLGAPDRRVRTTDG